MSRSEKLQKRVQSIADALNVGFYGEDGKLKMEYWNDYGIQFPDKFLSMGKAFKIISNIEQKKSLICMRLTGNLYFFIYYSWKADKVYLFVVDGAKLDDKVQKLSSTMTGTDLSRFVFNVQNSMDLSDKLGNSITEKFWKWANIEEDIWYSLK